MTNQEINGRIAKLCGWFPVEDTESGLWHLSNMDGRTIGYRSGLSETHAWNVLKPNYAESLDECSSFEDFSTGEEWDIYLDNLNEICDGENDPVVATPLQRCEAFLRLKGQWE